MENVRQRKYLQSSMGANVNFSYECTFLIMRSLKIQRYAFFARLADPYLLRARKKFEKVI